MIDFVFEVLNWCAIMYASLHFGMAIGDVVGKAVVYYQTYRKQKRRTNMEVEDTSCPECGATQPDVIMVPLEGMTKTLICAGCGATYDLGFYVSIHVLEETP